MAKRKKAFFRRAASRAGRYVRRGTSANKAQLIQMDAMAYGAIRAPVSNWVQSVVPLPVIGNVGDEVAMGLINWLVAKNTSGMLRNIAVKGLVIENARLGESLTQGLMPAVSGGNSGAYVYG